MPEYTLFRHRRRPELRCAVPLHRDLPDFLEAALWEEVAAPFDEGSAPPGFEAGAARYAIAVQGFYIFWRRTRAEIFARRTAAPYSA